MFLELKYTNKLLIFCEDSMSSDYLVRWTVFPSTWAPYLQLTLSVCMFFHILSASIPFNKLNKYEVFTDSCLCLRINNLDYIDGWLICFWLILYQYYYAVWFFFAILIWALLRIWWFCFWRFYQNNFFVGGIAHLDGDTSPLKLTYIALFEGLLLLVVN